jgi:hypothetical protein
MGCSEFNATGGVIIKGTHAGDLPPHCHGQLIEIDHYGERLVGCVNCNRWRWAGGAGGFPVALQPEDIEALRGRVREAKRTG